MIDQTEIHSILSAVIKRLDAPAGPLKPITFEPEGAFGSIKFEFGKFWHCQETPGVLIGNRPGYSGEFSGGMLTPRDVRALHEWLSKAVELLKEEPLNDRFSAGKPLARPARQDKRH